VSRWFRTYGYAGVYDHLIVGAVPLDSSDVDKLATLHVSRVLNLVDDAEYKRGERRKVERSLAGAAIEEQRLPTEDYGNLGPEALDEATARVNAWLDEGQVVYLHCRAGWQRSAAVAAATIALREGIEIDAALQRVQALKANADPLPHQREDLHAWWESRRAATRPHASDE
jgi:protein-tyrosine phosphatase